MKKILLLIMLALSVMPAFAINTPNTWVFNNYNGQEYAMSQIEDNSVYTKYWCVAYIPYTGCEIRHHTEYGYNSKDEKYYINVNDLIKDNIENNKYCINQLYLGVWYDMSNHSYYNVGRNNFYIFRNLIEDEVYNHYQWLQVSVVIKVYKEDGHVEIIFDGDISTGVNTINADTQEATYYNLQGIKVDNPTNGIFIKKVGNKTTKVKIL